MAGINKEDNYNGDTQKERENGEEEEEGLVGERQDMESDET